jgi:Membrane bound FAD containing D-sorbitol dehydrogenase
MKNAHFDLMLGLSRRAALGFGVAAAMTGFFPRWRVAAQTRVPDEVQARFLGWSRMATGFADLPADIARTCLERILRSGFTLERISALDPGAYRGTSLEKRLLEAWYTGVFKTAGSSETRCYETTLMWQAAGIDPPPTTCDGGPARWASAPSNI